MQGQIEPNIGKLKKYSEICNFEILWIKRIRSVNRKIVLHKSACGYWISKTTWSWGLMGCPNPLVLTRLMLEIST